MTPTESCQGQSSTGSPAAKPPQPAQPTQPAQPAQPAQTTPSAQPAQPAQASVSFMSRSWNMSYLSRGPLHRRTHSSPMRRPPVSRSTLARTLTRTVTARSHSLRPSVSDSSFHSWVLADCPRVAPNWPYTGRTFHQSFAPHGGPPVGFGSQFEDDSPFSHARPPPVMQAQFPPGYQVPPYGYRGMVSTSRRSFGTRS